MKKYFAVFGSLFLLASCGFLGQTAPEGEGTESSSASSEAAAPSIPACTKDADCGNGNICTSGACSTICAGIDEKCSGTRVCCFQDTNSDGASDASCALIETENASRCIIAATEEIEEVEEETVADELEEAIDESSASAPEAAVSSSASAVSVSSAASSDSSAAAVVE